MLTVAQIELPPSIRERLRERAAFADSFERFTRINILGFNQPVAAAAGLAAPLVIGVAYAAGDIWTTIQVTGVFFFATALLLFGTWVVNRTVLREAYAAATEARKHAKADLKAGKGEEMALTIKTPALFYENADGVVVFADAGENRTVFFDIQADREDPRWFLYLNGDLHRERWSWVRLSKSREVFGFSAAGHVCSTPGQPRYVEAAEGWDAIALALGDPSDGDIIDMPLREVEHTISRLLGDPQREFAEAS